MRKKVPKVRKRKKEKERSIVIDGKVVNILHVYLVYKSSLLTIYPKGKFFLSRVEVHISDVV